MTQELEIKNKLKIAEEVDAGSQNQTIVPGLAIEGTHERNPVLAANEEESVRKNKYKKPDRKFAMFFVPYIVGAVLFLLLIALNIVEWDWKYKAAIFLVSATVAFGASLWKGILTNWSEAAETYSQKGVDERKSFCDGIAMVSGLIAILSVLSSTIASHKVSVTVDDLKQSQAATVKLLCNLYAEQHKPCELPGMQLKK
ncbi:hypothetical protein [Gluconobacter oxydans]|uniref:Transmembrane protein n=1 Tax=Gluconobacter oxydans TaxID=442 RepID=A0AB35AQE2_GLUOY|nr:hypothetical protein [Gluconobacter oxydans]MBF0857103.1 hypothetical protein [Gluconobacter oxydans]TCW23279.1 hypothetical protein EDC20_1266 [Gluconobacter oxydans]